MSEEAPHTTTDETKTARRGRRLSHVAPAKDVSGCVMHHVRIHETLDNIIREIVRERGISFRDASEEAMLDYANKHGRRVMSITKEVEVRTIETVKIFEDASI
jgi:hypothetical protein